MFNKCSISFVIREMQIETMRYHVTLTRMAVIKKVGSKLTGRRVITL